VEQVLLDRIYNNASYSDLVYSQASRQLLLLSTTAPGNPDGDHCLLSSLIVLPCLHLVCHSLSHPVTPCLQDGKLVVFLPDNPHCLDVDVQASIESNGGNRPLTLHAGMRTAFPARPRIRGMLCHRCYRCHEHAFAGCNNVRVIKMWVLFGNASYD